MNIRPRCSVTYCKTNSLESLTGVSFHRFPKDKTLRDIWQEATGKVHWTPSSISSICSAHFKDDDFSVSRSGKRYLRDGTVPTIDLYVEEPFVTSWWPLFLPTDPHNDQNLTTNSENIQEPSSLITSTNTSMDYQQQNEQVITNLQNIVMEKDKKINKQNMRIHSLQRRNYSLKKRVNNIQKSLTQLEEKFYLQMQFLEELRLISAEMMRTADQNGYLISAADDVIRNTERSEPTR